VLWVSAGIRPEDVWAEMKRREDMFGIAEKLPKNEAKALAKGQQSASRRKIVALDAVRAHKRR
jgi:phosphoribosyl-ATP pyrophosphohydrolase